MKSWILHDVNNFTYGDHDMPILKAGEVMVEVKAAGICGSDIPRVYKTGAHKHPIIIGHEFAGVVKQCGPDTDAAWMGKHVGVFPLIPCGKCVPCKNKQYEMCRNYNYLGSRCDGGFADYVAVPEANLIELPEHVSFTQAAMMEPMAVAVHAMRRGFSLVGDNKRNAELSVAVSGLGTIGLLLVMFLKHEGIDNIYVIGNKEAQKKYVKELGVSEASYCDARSASVKDWLLEKTDGTGVDLFFECVGKNETIGQAVELTAPAGGIVLVGNPYSDIELDKNTYWKILRNQLKITGTWNSSFTHDDDDDWNYVAKCLGDGSIAPDSFITHTYEMSDLDKGFHIMRDKLEDYVKIMGIN